MKTIAEITETIKFPKFTDMFKNEVRPGDIICMTTTGTKYINTYLVTNKFTKGDRIILVDLINDKFRGYLDIAELTSNKHWYQTSIIKLNDTLPAYLKEKAEQLKIKFVSDLEQKKIDAIEKRKTVIQSRYFPVFYMNKNTKETGVIFIYIDSKPGKVISKTEILEAKNNLIQKYPNYILDYIDIDGGLSQLSLYKNKPELYSINRSYWTKQSGIKFCPFQVTDISYWSVKNNINKIFNQLIPIYTTQPDNMPEYKSNYRSYFSDNRYNYKIRYTDSTNNKVLTRQLGDVFSNEAIEKFHAFLKYYA